MTDFAETYALKVDYSTDVLSVKDVHGQGACDSEDQDDCSTTNYELDTSKGMYMCQVLIMATGTHGLVTFCPCLSPFTGLSHLITEYHPPPASTPLTPIARYAPALHTQGGGCLQLHPVWRRVCGSGALCRQERPRAWERCERGRRRRAVMSRWAHSARDDAREGCSRGEGACMLASNILIRACVQATRPWRWPRWHPRRRTTSTCCPATACGTSCRDWRETDDGDWKHWRLETGMSNRCGTNPPTGGHDCRLTYVFDRLSWQTHYVGDVRAVNGLLLDMYQV